MAENKFLLARREQIIFRDLRKRDGLCEIKRNRCIIDIRWYTRHRVHISDTSRMPHDRVKGLPKFFTPKSVVMVDDGEKKKREKIRHHSVTRYPMKSIQIERYAIMISSYFSSSWSTWPCMNSLILAISWNSDMSNWLSRVFAWYSPCRENYPAQSTKSHLIHPIGRARKTYSFISTLISQNPYDREQMERHARANVI